MPADVIMPALGMAQDTGKVLRWLKSEGDAVAKGEPLLEIETDKVTVEIESPADGTLAEVTAAEGEDVPVGRAVAVVVAAGETVASIPASQSPSDNSLQGTRRRLASPKARRIAAERGVDIDSVRGTGPNGAVVAADVEGARSAYPVPSNKLLRGERAAGARETVETGSVWRVMAERTQQAWQTVPHFYLRREVDASRLKSWRAAAQAKVSHTDLLVKVAAEALRRHPNVNRGERVNVAIAVATEDGLVAPVVHDADRLELGQIAERRAEIVARAREHRLRREDVSGGTFTVSNLGMYGVDSFDAIVNAPQAAILAVGRIHDRIVPVDGQPAVRPVLELTISFDHRVVDGARGAKFLDTLASLIEEPAGLVR